MISALLTEQWVMTRMLAELLDRAHEMGYEVTLGEAFRSKEEAERLAAAGKGIKDSLHCRRLAIDLNLFKGGLYLTRTEDYRPLGEFWESRGGTWGGRFKDGNHFSIEYGGRK